MKLLQLASALAILASTWGVAGCGPLFDSGPPDVDPFVEPPTGPEEPEEREPTPSESCFSPTQNANDAQVVGSQGCSCNVDYSVCVEDVGLTCIGGNWSYVEGFCERTEPPPPKETEPPEEPEPPRCEERLESAHEQVANAVADANKRCVYDDDCMIVGEDTGCWSGCPGDAIAVNGSASVLDVIDAIDAGICSDFATECSEFYEMLDCGGRTAICVEGLCEIG